MVRFKKRILILLCVIVAFATFFSSAYAGNIEKEKTYKPLDLVVVVDSSGSMLDSDRDRTALAAVRMLVNMMPAGDSKVGVIGFNKTANVLTKDAKGNDALLNLNSLTDIATIKKNVSDVVYNGGTGIGNAVFAATELLKNNASDGRDKAIILFTDGVNDFGNDAIALSNCEENEATALLWAKKNNCPIYCVGYDYVMSDGTSSMGKNGEGLKKLENISSTTCGNFKSINSIDEIEQLLIEFLADVCDLNYTTVATIPGDGGKHECKIPVSPSVVEANIRIAGGNENSIANGKIQLFDPDGNEVELRNSGNIRFDTDATAASIKVTMPKTGEWLLVVEGIKGDDIHVGLLEHFKMNLTSTITLPEGNPDGVAYSNDEIGIKTWLTYDGQNLNDEAIYTAVKSATAVCVPRANPENKKTIKLQRDGLSFVGKFVIPQDCFYDITIRLDWDTVYREDTLEIQSSNKPLYIVKEISDIKVNKNKTTTIDNLYQYVADDENDKIEASVSLISSPDVVDVKIENNDLIITGKKWSSTLVTVVFTDNQGNTVESVFKTKVHDPVAVAIIILIIVLIIVSILLFIYLLYKRSFRIRGKIRVALIEKHKQNDSQSVEIRIFEDRNRKYKDPTKINKSDFEIDNPFAGAERGFGSPGFGFAEDTTVPTENNETTNFAFGFGSEPGFPADGFDFGFSENGATQNPIPGSFDTFSTKTETAVDTVEEQLSAMFSSGEMQLGNVVGKKDQNLYAVLSEFVKRYRHHMTSAGTIEYSVLAQQVEDFIKYNFSEFKQIKIAGSRFGRKGITLTNETKGKVKFISPRQEKNKISTKSFGRNLVVFKVSVPMGIDSDKNQYEAYIEIEYINN